MREIKIRAYAVPEMVGSQWLYGFGVYAVEYAEHYAKEIGREQDWYLYTEAAGVVQVNENSIGQYTGLKDKNGQEIYEGDIVKGVGWDDENEIYIVEFGNGEYYLDSPEGADYEYYNGDYPHGDRVQNWYESEVIGNIYENPELLDKEEKANVDY
ncbi:YopX family protein [Metabacillus fastidiosus]|uniref:YopX family protein n=1 Tax=Metabacillus fastidiosus TaxID=1458 RepID=UPI003D2E1E53